MTGTTTEYDLMVPLFVLPASVSGLFTCLMYFLCVTAAIVLFEKIWSRSFVFKTKEEQQIQRILLWELGTVCAIIIVYIFRFYCVILPLLFLLASLAMWYLVRIIGRQ